MNIQELLNQLIELADNDHSTGTNMEKLVMGELGEVEPRHISALIVVLFGALHDLDYDRHLATIGEIYKSAKDELAHKVRILT